MSENKTRLKRERKIANAKIYEDKRDLYCISDDRHLVTKAGGEPTN